MYDEEKLMEILEENNVGTSKQGKICLYDLVKNVIGSKNPDMYKHWNQKYSS